MGVPEHTDVLASGSLSLVSTSDGKRKRRKKREKITAYIRNFPVNDVRMW